MRLVIDLQGAQGANHARGIGRYSHGLASAMARQPRGHDLVVALNGALLETAEALADEFGAALGPSQVQTWFPPLDRALASSVRAQFLAGLRPDLVHVSSVFEGFGDAAGVTTSPAGLERLKMAATCYDLIPFIRHEAYFGPGGTMAAHRARYYACLHELSLMDGLLAISSSSRREAVDHLALDPSTVFDVGVGIGPAFHPVSLAPAQQDELRACYGLWGAFILFVGAGDARKNEAALVEAFTLLPPVLQATHQLMIVGAVDERPLRAALAYAGCDDDRLVLAPLVSEHDLIALYSHCALFVFPSLHEGFGLPAAEAMACGAAVLVSNVSSLPDIVGRADATFDPTSAQDIALGMTRVLRSPKRRLDLAAHGRERVAAMTWEAAAARAWDALETIHDRTAPRRLQRRRSLAFVSPLPPQQTGIADYSRTLLPALSRHYDITLVSEHGTTDDPLLAASFPHLDTAGFLTSGAKFDRVVYQLGCSEFHDFQYRALLPAHPGVAVLHDASLAHLWNFQAHLAGRPDDFLDHLHRSHGYQALVFERARGRDAAIGRYPCCGEVLDQAVWTIGHSGYAVALSFAGADCSRSSVIPQVAHLRPRPDRAAARRALGIAADEFVLCSFGIVSTPKQPAMLLEAWRAIRGVRGRLAFVGALLSDAEALSAPAEDVPRLTGRVDRETYDRWFAASDLAVQLRRPSQGETSAAITDCLCFGVPLIVNDHGAAHELPDDCALKLSNDFGATELRDAIESLRDDPARRDRMAQAGQAFARHDLRPVRIAGLYAGAIEQAYAAPSSGLAPTNGRPAGRLLIDVSELARHDSRSGIQRVVREVASRLLTDRDVPWQVETVRFKDGGLRWATQAGTRIVGTRLFGGTEPAVDARPGDVLLCLDPNASMTQDEFMDLRRRRLAGTRVVLVVYDLLPMQRPDFFTAGIVRVSTWYRRALSIADHALCISRAVADELAAWLDDHPQLRRTRLPIDWFHLAGDFRDDDDAPSHPEVAGAITATERRPTLLMTGTLEPRKGYGQALAAFEQLWADGHDIGLIIVGRQGWDTEVLAQRLRDHVRAGAELHWLPGIPDTQLRQLYRAASGLLMASEGEGFGLPLVEAARAGLPILARDLPVFREIVGTHATFFTGHAPDDLAHALSAWLEARQHGGLPAPDAIATLSWDGSTAQLLSRLTGDAPYHVWSPPKPPR